MLAEYQDEVKVVVTDIEMPRLNGLDLTRRIRGEKSFSGLPVIALSSLADEAAVLAGKNAGVSSYEIKLDKDKLLERVRQVFSEINL